MRDASTRAIPGRWCLACRRRLDSALPRPLITGSISDRTGRALHAGCQPIRVWRREMDVQVPAQGIARTDFELEPSSRRDAITVADTRPGAGRWSVVFGVRLDRLPQNDRTVTFIDPRARATTRRPTAASQARSPAWGHAPIPTSHGGRRKWEQLRQQRRMAELLPRNAARDDGPGTTQTRVFDDVEEVRSQAHGLRRKT